MAQDPASDLLSARFPENEEDDHAPFTDDEYAQRLQFQETLYSSFVTSKRKKKDPSSSSSSSSSSLLILTSSSSSSAPLKIADTCPAPKTEDMEHSNETCESCLVICEICAETIDASQMFRNKRCNHSFCSDCVTKQVATQIQESITEVPCPGLDCKTVYDLEACRPWLPKDLLERWDQALCDALFLQVPKFYCPFKDCSAMMLVENEEDQRGAGETDFPVCHRMFCPRCNVPWHPGIDCGEYQKLNEDERQREDLLVRKLAKEKKWGRCPKCKFYVEKMHGCLHITCRCKYEFCYACGEEWSSNHGGCQRN